MLQMSVNEDLVSVLKNIRNYLYKNNNSDILDECKKLYKKLSNYSIGATVMYRLRKLSKVPASLE